MLTNQNSGAIIKSIQKRLNNNKKESDEKGFWQRKKGFSGKVLFAGDLQPICEHSISYVGEMESLEI